MPLNRCADNASAFPRWSVLSSLRQHAEALTAARITATANAVRQTYTDSFYHTAFEIQKGIGVGWSTQTINERQIEKVLSRPWTMDNQTFTERCWKDKEKLVETVNQELTRMTATGASPRKAIDVVTKQFNVSRSNAGRVVMTESAHFAIAAQKDCFEELDIEKYIVVGTLDSSTCENCGAMDGKVFKMSEFQEGSTAPPFHPWCRCCTAPYFEDMDGIGERFARDSDGNSYTVPKDMTYEEWKEKAVQNGVENFGYSGIIKDKLTEDEERAITDYISSDSYKINPKLRSGEALNKREQTIADNLESALTKMPEYRGTVYRSLSSDMMKDPKHFWNEHAVGNVVSYDAFTSASTFVYDKNMDIRKYNSDEGEILFNRNSKFYVSGIKNNIIYLEEV